MIELNKPQKPLPVRIFRSIWSFFFPYYHIRKAHPRASILRMKELCMQKANPHAIVAIEIGTHEGVNAMHMLKELDIKTLYCIDPYEDYSEYGYKYGGLSESEKKAHKLLDKYEYKILWIKKYSADAINDVPMADFIYIDGNHDYEYVKQDIEMYWKKVKPGGILAGHDIDFGKIYKAVSEFTVENNLECEVSYQDWIIRK